MCEAKPCRHRYSEQGAGSDHRDAHARRASRRGLGAARSQDSDQPRRPCRHSPSSWRERQGEACGAAASPLPRRTKAQPGFNVPSPHSDGGRRGDLQRSLSRMPRRGLEAVGAEGADSRPMQTGSARDGSRMAAWSIGMAQSALDMICASRRNASSWSALSDAGDQWWVAMPRRRSMPRRLMTYDCAWSWKRPRSAARDRDDQGVRDPRWPMRSSTRHAAHGPWE